MRSPHRHRRRTPRFLTTFDFEIPDLIEARELGAVLAAALNPYSGVSPFGNLQNAMHEAAEAAAMLAIKLSIPLPDANHASSVGSQRTTSSAMTAPYEATGVAAAGAASGSTVRLGNAG